MAMLLATLGMLFGASLVATLLVRGRASAWPPPGMPPLPSRLWLSTVLIVAASAALAGALRAARRDDLRALRRLLLLSLVLGVAFLASQTASWFTLVAEHVTPARNLWAFTFFVLTALHAVHVVGGLIPLSTVTVKAFGGRYSAPEHAGVEYTAMYWHFLDAVWLVLFVVLVLL